VAGSAWRGITTGSLRTLGRTESGGDGLKRRCSRDGRPAAEGISGGRAPVSLGGEEVVGRLLGKVRRLGAGSIKGEEDRRETFHGELEAAAAALVGKGFRPGLKGDWGVRKHERGSGQLARGFHEDRGCSEVAPHGEPWSPE
jgi:hypothetical protein